MIKLLALDLDGTTLNSFGTVSAENRLAIRAAEEAGVLVTIATGRRFRDARPIGLELELNAPLISHNGGLLKYSETLATVHCSLLDTETALEVVSIGREIGGDALVSVDPHGIGKLLYDRVSEDNIPLRKYIRWAENLHGGVAGREGVEHVGSLSEAVQQNEVVHISFSGTCARMREVRATLESEFQGTVTILATIYEELDFTLLDILPPDASKGHGVRHLAELHGFTAENVMVIGDNFNDLEMLEYAGTPVIMGNADPSLLEQGEFYTTLSNDEHGVADAIERFILNGDKT
ncbi:MAG: HAD family phosphatase [Acidobacteriota bacterium]|nr:MAG: HAD family phosphatase [Acidobacteriota bacterium]